MAQWMRQSCTTMQSPATRENPDSKGRIAGRAVDSIFFLDGVSDRAKPNALVTTHGYQDFMAVVGDNTDIIVPEGQTRMSGNRIELAVRRQRGV